MNEPVIEQFFCDCCGTWQVCAEFLMKDGTPIDTVEVCRDCLRRALETLERSELWVKEAALRQEEARETAAGT